MIVLIGNWRGTQFNAIREERPNIGNLLSPEGWKRPLPGCPYALDNDVYAHSFLGQRCDPEWWCAKGEAAWLRMLDKIPADNLPMWVLLPDVVADWPRTLLQARTYRGELAARGLPSAVALQDGCRFEEAAAFAPAAVFVAGSTAWKWANVEPACRYFQPRGIRVHVGRASGPRRIRECLRVGADSCDGTGWVRHSRAMLPGLWRELDGTDPQCRLEI